MSQSEQRRRMTGTDAMFLYFERKEMPLHIGCVVILDGPFDEESELLLAARLHEIPQYRRRVIFSPLNLTHPSWEDDPAFNICNHIRRVRLEPPGSEQQLSELSGQVFTELMDRNKPLWDLTVIDGVEGGRSALIIRVHHSLVDGVSGVGLVNVMFDPSREPRQVEAKPFNAPPLPDAGQALADSMGSIWGAAASRFIGAQLTMLRLVQAFTGDSASAAFRGMLATMPELLKPAQKLPFNGPCSGVRGHCWTTVPFGEARAIRSALGGTINDVVMATVAGAISRYVKAHRETVKDRFARLLVPVNLRSPGEPGGGLGNEISMLPLSVPLDIEDPAQRLKVVTMRSAAMKSARIADVVALIGTWIGWAPPALQQSLAALPFLPQPIFMFNMVCTNVPGPMVPLYSNGRQLLTYYPHVPCGSEVGISVAISSYNQNLYYGITYDHQAAPDGELFRDFLIESYEELRGAAGVAAMPASRSGRQEPVRVSPTDLRAHRAQETPPIPEAVVAKEEKPAEVDSADLPSGPLPQPAAESETVPISAESPASESETQPQAEVEISAPAAEEIIIAADEPVRAEQDQLQLAAQMDVAEPEVASEFCQAVAEPMAVVTETTVEAEGLQPEVPAPEVTTALPLVGEVVARLEAEPPQKVSSVETTTPAIHEPELHAAARTNGQAANKPRPKERKTRHRKTAKAGASAA